MNATENTTLGTEPVYFIKGRKWLSRGRTTEGGFTVYAGSTVNDITDSFTREQNYFPLRKKLMEDGIIRDGIFIVDHLFRSAAEAGCVIACRLISTNKEWKTEDENEHTWGECHPRMAGEKKSKRSVYNIAITVATPPEGYSRMNDGTQVFFRTNADGSTVERRGRCW